MQHGTHLRLQLLQCRLSKTCYLLLLQLKQALGIAQDHVHGRRGRAHRIHRHHRMNQTVFSSAQTRLRTLAMVVVTLWSWSRFCELCGFTQSFAPEIHTELNFSQCARQYAPVLLALLEHPPLYKMVLLHMKVRTGRRAVHRGAAGQFPKDR